MKKKAKKKEEVMKKAMHKFEKGELHSGSKKGPVVKEKKQAEAIGMSEMKRGGCGGMSKRGK